METVGPREGNCKLLMGRAYEDEQTRLIARELGYTLVVPPRSNRRKPWEYDLELYKRRNEVERFFRRLKAFRCVCTRYEKLDVMFTAQWRGACLTLFVGRAWRTSDTVGVDSG